MHHDRVRGERSRDVAILVGYPEAQRGDALARASQRNEVEQLVDFVPNDAPGFAVAEVGVGLGYHHAVDVEPRRQSSQPAPLVRITHTQRRASSPAI